MYNELNDLQHQANKDGRKKMNNIRPESARVRLLAEFADLLNKHGADAKEVREFWLAHQEDEGLKGLLDTAVHVQSQLRSGCLPDIARGSLSGEVRAPADAFPDVLPSVKPDLSEIERRARAATKGPWSRCTANNGNCPCFTIWSTPLDDTPFCLAPSGLGVPVRIEDWDFVTTLDPTTALALVARIRALDEALNDAIAHVPAGEERERLVKVLADMDPIGKCDSTGTENPGIVAFIKAHQS